jgi:hypothetical protein
MTLEDFRHELLDLVERASVSLPTTEILLALENEAVGCSGALIRAQLDSGTWPPEEPIRD